MAWLIFLLCTPAWAVRAQSSLDYGFDSGRWPTEPVRAVAVQQDGKVLIGGAFQTGAGNIGIARLNPDGSLDETFGAWADGTVHTIRVLPGGLILVGGGFQHVNEVRRPGLARLKPDGTLDETFDAGMDGTVFSVAELPRGQLVVGGFFSRAGGEKRHCVARLNPDGSADPYFDPGLGPNSYVFSVAARADGRVVIGGWFVTFNGQERPHLARLHPDGSLDDSFIWTANGPVFAVAVQPDGETVVGGQFTWFTSAAVNNLVRINADDSLDTGFNFRAPVSGEVRALTALEDGKLLVGGGFTKGAGGQTYANLVRLAPDGQTDPTLFTPEMNGPVNSVAVQEDGRILIAGEFLNVGGQQRRYVARLHPSGVPDGRKAALDESFAPEMGNGSISALAVQPDGKVIFGGRYSDTAGQSHRGVFRLNPDGSADRGFSTQLDSEAESLAVQPDGKIMIGGQFTTVNGRPRPHLARLHPDGSLDETFDAGLVRSNSANIKHIEVLADGRLLAAGTFWEGSQAVAKLARFERDGSPDNSFAVHLGRNLYALAVQPDGKALVSYFSYELRVDLVVRINPDGTFDDTFQAPDFNWQVFRIVPQPDGRILVGGAFTSVGGQERRYAARLNPDGSLDDSFNPAIRFPVMSMARQTDGRILIGITDIHADWELYTAVERLNPDGSHDPTIFFEGDGLWARAMALQADGRVLVANLFLSSGDRPWGILVRLINTGDPAQHLSADPSGGSVTWSRAGVGPDVDRVTFEVSTDGATYTPLGEGTRAPGGWRLGGLALPPNQNLHVRARGFISTRHSTYFVETTRSVFLTGARP